jgi:hypothetical protein
MRRREYPRPLFARVPGGSVRVVTGGANGSESRRCASDHVGRIVRVVRVCDRAVYLVLETSASLRYIR